MNRLCLVGLSALLGACASYTAGYQERLIDSLPFKREATVEESKRYPGQVLCGRYKALDAGGYRFETHDFVVTPTLVKNRPTPDEKAVYCSRDPEAALTARLGVGGDDAAWATLRTVHDDMQAIANGIQAFHLQKLALPNNTAALVDVDPGPTAAQLTDPWGRLYRYEGGLSGRTEPRFQLYTLGADGRIGGDGENADIKWDQLPLLSHVLAVRGS